MSLQPLTSRHGPTHALQSALPYSRPATPGGSTPQPLRIGWIGLGAMGYFMARNLAKNRGVHPDGAPPLLVWNRSTSKSHQLVKEVGESLVTIAQSVGDIATQCDIIVSSLASDEVVKSVYSEITKVLKSTPPTKNKIFVETSTIYPTVAGELDVLVSSVPHCHLVTAPVLGPPAMAENGTLVILMSGDYRSKKEIAYLFVPAIGRRVLDLGGNIEKAPTFKLIGNSLVLGSLEVLAEAFTMSEKSGIGQELVYEYVKELIPAPLWIAYADKMLNDKFDGSTGFSIDGGIKDASHIRRLTSEHNAPMPVIDTAHQHLLTARAIHEAQARTGSTQYPVLDWSAIVAGTRVSAGLDAFDSKTHTGPVVDE